MSLIPGTVWKHWSSCDRKAERRPLDHFFVLSITMYSITHSAYPLVTQRYLVRSWTVIALQCLSSSKPYFISLWPLKRNSKDAACTHVLWSVERWTHKNILREKTDIYLTVVAEYCCNCFICQKLKRIEYGCWEPNSTVQEQYTLSVELSIKFLISCLNLIVVSSYL